MMVTNSSFKLILRILCALCVSSSASLRETLPKSPRSAGPCGEDRFSNQEDQEPGCQLAPDLAADRRQQACIVGSSDDDLDVQRIEQFLQIGCPDPFQGTLARIGVGRVRILLIAEWAIVPGEPVQSRLSGIRDVDLDRRVRLPGSSASGVADSDLGSAPFGGLNRMLEIW